MVGFKMHPSDRRKSLVTDASRSPSRGRPRPNLEIFYLALLCLVFTLTALPPAILASSNGSPLIQQVEPIPNHNRPYHQPPPFSSPALDREPADKALQPGAKKHTSLSQRGLFGAQRSFLLSARPQSGSDLVLSDAVILTSVEGGLYSVDRVTGRQIWALPPQSSRSGGDPRTESLLRPLVSALYGPKQHSFTELAQGLGHGFASQAETLEGIESMGIYIVEPSSAGDIYVLSTRPGSPGDLRKHAKLDKLPLTVPQLVELSPFSFAGDDTRVFVGRKQTTLVELDVRTGKLGAVFGGEKAGVWCGENVTRGPGRAAAASEGCSSDDDAGFKTSEWAYIGRTDYTLSIHSRNSPDLLQTLHFSTFAPNAGDRDIQAIWSASPHPDDRAIMGMPEDGTVVCFNVSDSAAPLEGDEQSAKTLWTSDLQASIAGVFDVVYPAPHLQVSSSAVRRPVLVSHPTVPLHRIFPQIADQPSWSTSTHVAGGNSKAAYLGVAGESLYAMSGSKFPLVALAPKATAGLPEGDSSSDKATPTAFLPIAAGAGRERCASYGCWLGSYSIDVDLSAEGALQESLFGKRPLLEIGDGSKDGRSPLPALNDHAANPNKPTRGASSRPSVNSRPLPLERPSDPENDDEDDDVGPDEGEVRTERSRKGKLAIALLQLCAVLILCLLGCAIYLGLEQQKKEAEQSAKAIAREVVWIPALKEEEAGFSIQPEAELSAKVTNGDETPKVSKKDSETEALLSSSSSSSQALVKLRNSSSDLQASPSSQVSQADGKGPRSTSEDFLPGGTAAAKKRAGKRRRRGKRAGAAVKAKEEGEKAVEGEEDDGGDEDGEEDGVDGKEMEREKLKPSTLSLLRNGPLNPADPLSDLTPTTSAALMGSGWIDAAPDSAAGEEQIVRLAAGASSSDRTLSMKASSLSISDEILGYGSSGTVVFKGTFQGRAVAVKRLLRDFVNVASKEVSLLESADNHPNVIRYFYKELTSSFLFIALELCPASLADIVERPADHRELSNLLEPKKALSQIASGLSHLHKLSIVHRDIKPQNILVNLSSGGKLKMLLSDFGLSKRLDGMAQTSFSQTMNNPGGTVGWRAPEILRGDVNLDAGTDSTQSSMDLNSTVGSSGSGSNGRREEGKRLTRAVDVFAMGCLAYYILSNGDHPFGSRFEREMNIIKRKVDTSRLDGLGEEGHEAQDLVLRMVDNDPRNRPTASEVLSHPYFWDSNRRLAFLQDASDRFEIMGKDPPTPTLEALESRAASVIGSDWHRRCDKMFVDDLGKFRKYDPRSVQDLLRAMRNKKHHYQDMSPALKKILGPLPDGFLGYFTRRFPNLFLHVHAVVHDQPSLRAEPVFRGYFSVAEEDH
ncbi:hypothetical protein IE53DRAFT_382586 [Violaceomyces palustris]|uniref:Uncharacterized protein n=1 Tax=Violaceomyces palustris TaxID=1673888 RepID=A0ACD0NLY9_9BASI|nr:hypothetical protein IE53DRAFT_382586 [Violaceomyces palustris]